MIASRELRSTGLDQLVFRVGIPSMAVPTAAHRRAATALVHEPCTNAKIATNAFNY